MGVTQATKKQLFAASGNECAFPDCDEEVVDIEEETVIGVIAHIRARNPDGPRYDPDMPEEERDEFSNLMVLCPTHHTRIDKNPEKYPPEKLEEWKEQHEQEPTEEEDIPEDLLGELKVESVEVNIEDGSFISTKNQMGGQVAHDITNVGQQPRSIPDHVRQAIADELSKFEPLSGSVAGLMGNGETMQLAEQIIDILERAGWDVEELPNQVVMNRTPQGIIIRMPEEKEPAVALGKLLLQAGLHAEGAIDEERDDIEVVVGANL